MKIEELSQEQLPAYYQLAHQFGTIFQSREWLNIYDDRVRYFGFIGKNGDLNGGLCLYEQKKCGLRILRNPPYTPYIGPFMDYKTTKPLSLLNKQKELARLTAEQIKRLNPAISFFSLNPEHTDCQPFIWSGFHATPETTYRIDLTQTSDPIWRAMSDDRRNSIRKAEKDGLHVELTRDNHVVRHLVESTFSRQSKTLEMKLLDRILFQFANQNNSYAYTTYQDQTPLVTCFILFDQNQAYYLLGGYNAAQIHHGAGPLSVWQAITHAREMGLKIFDFEGSMIPSIEHYFRSFGGEFKTYYRISRAWWPLELGLKLKKRAYF